MKSPLLRPVLAVLIGLGATSASFAKPENETPAYRFTTLAGTGKSGHRDGPGPQALFGAPEGIAVDRAGHLYITEYAPSIVRKVAPDGATTLLAGQPNVIGDKDGPAGTALFNRPHGSAVDTAGNVYIADMKNHTIRRIAPDGTVTTVGGVPGVAGADDGPAATAKFKMPEGVAVDAAGVIYVADTYNLTIRAITPDGQVRTVAGRAGQRGSKDGKGQQARFFRPLGVAVDAAGWLYVIDANYDGPDLGNGTVRKISPAGDVTTLAGLAGETGPDDGRGPAARFHKAVGIAVTADGIVFVADTEADTIRRITPDGTVTTIGGAYQQEGLADGVGAEARFKDPQAIAVDAEGNLYIADTFNHCIRKGTPVTPAR